MVNAFNGVSLHIFAKIYRNYILPKPTYLPSVGKNTDLFITCKMFFAMRVLFGDKQSTLTARGRFVMKKIWEKVALVALVVITLIFVITTLLYMSNVIPQAESWLDNGVLTVLMLTLALVYLAISGYLLYVNFSQTHNLRQVLLLCDSESATHANAKVINNVVRSCAKQVGGVKVRKTKIRSDDKKGFVATITINVNAEDTANTVNKLRCLLVDGFRSTLGLTFNCIDFVIAKLNNHYTPNLSVARQNAETLSENQEQVDEIYQDPLHTDDSQSKQQPDGQDNGDKQND